MSATVTEHVREDGTKEIRIKPPPAVLSLSALRAQGYTKNLRQLVDDLRAKGIRVTLTPEQQAEYDALKARGE